MTNRLSKLAKPIETLALLANALLLTAWSPVQTGDAPGAPGVRHQWAPALKQAIGTSASRSSPIWFTIAEGILTEVQYPTIDQSQVGDLQILVTDGVGFFSEQKRDTRPEVEFQADGMSVVVRGEDRTGRYSYLQTYVTDPNLPVVRIHTRMRFQTPGLKVYLLFKPTIGNTAARTVGSLDQEGLLAQSPDTQIAALVKSSVPFVNGSVGYVGTSDGWQDLSKNFRITRSYLQAGPGNVALVAELKTNGLSDFEFDTALSLGSSRASAVGNLQTSVGLPFAKIQALYEQGWSSYVQRLESQLARTDSPTLLKSEFARRSAVLIKMHEDKSHPGAIIASLSRPGIPGPANANDEIGGYSLVWPRDLYHSAMGLLAAGDLQTPRDVLDFLASVQKPDGSWWQNFYINGKPYWKGLQMDQVAFPILLAHHLVQMTGGKLERRHLAMIQRAADFIATHGPTTEQDRWEEIGGYVPSTLAAQIAALRAAGALLGGSAGGGLQHVADTWQSRLETWTLVPESALGRNYYLRVSFGGNAARNESYDIANGGGRATTTEILDGGFLELVRLGVRSATDPRILSTLRYYDAPETGLASSGGAASYRRYNRDAYGPNHQGGFWSLLAGERGHYAVAARDFKRARAQLAVMESSSLSTGLLPEQNTRIVTATDAASPAGANVACPLVWAHAEYLRLSRSINEGRVFDTP